MFTCIELYCINNCSNQSWNQVTGSAIYAESGRVGSRVSIVKPCLDALVVIILVVVVVAVAVATKQVQNKHKYSNRRHAHCTTRQDKKLSCRRELMRCFMSLNILLSHSLLFEITSLSRTCVLVSVSIA